MITSSLSIRVINSTQMRVSLKPQSPLEIAVREGEGKEGGRREEEREGRREEEREGRREERMGALRLSMPLVAGLLAACLPQLLSPCPLPQALPRTLSAWEKCTCQIKVFGEVCCTRAW